MRRNPSETSRRGRARSAAFACALLALAGRAGPARAQTEFSDECCVTLLRPTGARALSLGDAVIARTYADALFVNPALTGPLTDDAFLIHNASTTLEDSNTFTLLLATTVGSFALSYRLNDFGEIETRPDIPGAPPTGSVALLEHTLLATYGTKVAAGLSAGISYKLFQFRLECRGFCGTEPITATTHLIDVGAHLAVAAVPGLNLGASLTNLGLSLQVINEAQASPPPTRIRVGGAYEVLQHTEVDSIARLYVSAEVIERPTAPGSPTVNVGAELSLDETLFLRGGYGGSAGTAGGAGIGVGLRYDRFDLAVAKSFVSSALSEGDPFQVTFAIRF